MRLCENENVTVFEEAGDDLATLLREAADLVEAQEHGWAGVVVGQSLDYPYLVTVYLH